MQVRDVDALRRELEDSGVDIVEPPADKPWGLRETQVQDHDRVKLIIVQMPKEHPFQGP